MIDPAKILLPATARGTPILLLRAADWKKAETALPAATRAWAKANGFKAEAGRALMVPDSNGAVGQVLAGLSDTEPFVSGQISRQLPEGAYVLHGKPTSLDLFALGWCLEAYGFDSYRNAAGKLVQLACPKGVDRDGVLRSARASYLVRDLVNTPASDMGPDELEAAARAVAKAQKALVKVISGKQLEREFPMIYAVGKASPRAPRLIDFSWGPAKGPKLTLVGKGVCFDTGGLDIKPASGMLLMKKDMGGAANVLGLAQMIMDAKLPVRLRVLIPAVENSISGNAFRPGDVLQSRKGLTIEIGNTDAEGRLVLGDALALADEDKPDLIIDMATLTGAARVALGPDLPPFYTDDDSLSAELEASGRREHDPVWRLPFWQPYTRLFESSIADMNNSGDSGFAGSITAALFLKRFVEHAKAYLHFDVFAWTPAARPGRPKGGEAQAIRALFAMISSRYAK